MQSRTATSGVARKPLKKGQKLILAGVALLCGALGFFALPHEGPEYREGYHYGKLEAEREGGLLEKDFNIKGHSEKWQKGFWEGYHQNEG